MEYTGAKRCFNIGSGTGASLNELICMIEEVLGKRIERNYLPGRPFDVPVSVLNNDLARKELQWEPSISMRNGIARTAKWMEKELAR
jgi:UDP-glucose 4-epimerase